MKTTSITVERNFHIMNDDRFIMEKIGMTIELENDDSITTAISLARQTIENNFRLAYSKVEARLNFDESVIQVNSHIPNNSKIVNPDNLKWVNNPNAPISKSDEKINKGTIEELKQEMRSYKLGMNAFAKVYENQVKGNEELQKVYDEKMDELITKQ